VDDAYAYQYVTINTTAIAGGGIARAIVPSDRMIDPRDGYSYCDPNGAGATRTRPFTLTRNGRTYDGQKLIEASVKPRVSWTYGEVTTRTSSTSPHRPLRPPLCVR
jgi:hypothetical protein